MSTGGRGASLSDRDGLEPLVTADSIIPARDNRFVISVNTGSSDISVFEVQCDYTLKLVSKARVSGFGPANVAYRNGFVYAATIEADDQLEDNHVAFALKGALTGFFLSRSGKLIPLWKSTVTLTNRPADIRFSPDGRSLVVISTTTGSVELNSDVVEEVSVFSVSRKGKLSEKPVTVTTSTKRDNPDGRHLPSAIGAHFVVKNGVQYLIVTEARVIGPNGNLIFDGTGMLVRQTPSISIWKITSSSRLIPVQLDVLVEGQLTTCWIEFSKDEGYFWVANTISNTLSSFSFRNGKAKLVDRVAARANFPLDMWRSADGKHLYQLTPTSVEVFEIENNGRGAGLTRIQTAENFPEGIVEGIVAI